MPKVLIVGKTKMGKGICIGGIVLVNDRSVRLLPPENGYSLPRDTQFDIGEIWNLEWQELPSSELTPPHTEDVRVISQEFVKELRGRKLRDRILRITDAPLISPDQLFDNCILPTRQRKAYVDLYGSRPQYSTGFWRLDKALHRRLDEGGGVRYLYCRDDMPCDFNDQDLVFDIPYVGKYNALLEIIPRDTLLRFSLSREWEAGRYVGFWLQLSGWFL